jgi:hypothetical protein
MSYFIDQKQKLAAAEKKNRVAFKMKKFIFSKIYKSKNNTKPLSVNKLNFFYFKKNLLLVWFFKNFNFEDFFLFFYFFCYSNIKFYSFFFCKNYFLFLKKQNFFFFKPIKNIKILENFFTNTTFFFLKNFKLIEFFYVPTIL